MTGLSSSDERATRIWNGLWAGLFDLEARKREVATTLDISFAKTRALRRLVGGPLAMRELPQLLSTDPPYVTLLIDDLESRGYVTRTVNPEDKRTKTVAITPAGAEVAARAQQILDRPPEALLALPEEDLVALDRIVATLLQ
jgi:DNA-binding MarR family transcriptional regulator